MTIMTEVLLPRVHGVEEDGRGSLLSYHTSEEAKYYLPNLIYKHKMYRPTGETTETSSREPYPGWRFLSVGIVSPFDGGSPSERNNFSHLSPP